MERRTFLSRGTGALLGLAGSGAIWRALAQDGRDGSQSRGMITANAQNAIDTGLAYLAAHQHADGSFGTNQYQGNIAVAGLCGLAFLAGGYQPGRGRYGQAVTRTIQYILDNESGEPHGFLTNPRAVFHGPMYGHGFATLFLAEVYGMVNDGRLRQQLRETLRRAIRVIIDSQNSEGGWRYHPHPADADLSVTICQIMALRAARNAGVAVPKTTADRCIRYVKDCQDLRGSGGFRYQKHAGQPGFARTAAGVVALYSAGVYDGEAVDKGLSYLKQFQPGTAQANNLFPNAEVQLHYFYGHYYAVQAMWIAGGEYWREWYPAIRNELLASRRPEGFWQMGILCSHYCTAMALIILQVPNNYLPILQR